MMTKLAPPTIAVVLAACGIDSVGQLAREESPAEAEPSPSAPDDASAAAPGARDAGDEVDAGRGGAETTVPTCADRALAFDGVDDFVSVPGHPALDLSGDFTVEAWINPGPRAASGDEMHVVSHHDQTQSRGWSLLVRSRRVEIVVWGSDSLGAMAYSAGNAGPAYVVAGQWMHVAGTLTGGVLRIYAGGILRDTQVLGGDFVRQAAAQTLTIGRPAFMSSLFFEGMVDDVRLSNTARATGTTTSVPTAALPSDGSTVALFHFDETAGPAVVDSSAGAAHGGTIGNGSRAPARVVVPCASLR